MNSFGIVLKEIRQRMLSALLILLAVAVATATVLTVVVLNKALWHEVRKLTRDMGTNLVVFPADAKRERYFYGTEPPTETLPQEYIERLLALKPGVARHMVGKLLTSVRIDGERYVLTGTGPERDTVAGKSQLGMVIAPESVQVGAAAAEELGWSAGRSVVIEGRAFRVEKVLPESGSRDDFAIFAPLDEVQALVGKPGRLTVVEALGCLCEGDYLSTVKERIAQALPGTRVVSMRNIAVARIRARRSVARVGFGLSFVVVVLAAVGGAASFLANVGHRRTEIGILMAMGCRSRRVVWLFLLKAITLGLVAGLVGFAAAAALVRALTPVLLGWQTSLPKTYVFWSGAFALALGVVVSLPAVWRLCRLDPADVLREM